DGVFPRLLPFPPLMRSRGRSLSNRARGRALGPTRCAAALLRAAPLVVLAGLCFAACFDSGTRWDPTSFNKKMPEAPACKVGEIRCGIGLERCESGASGVAWKVIEDCGADGRVCAPALLKCTHCIPNTTSCSGLDVITCDAAGERDRTVMTCD